MSSEVIHLSLRMEGPLQSWGVDSDYNRRSTELMPTKSAVAGICCAAAGADRGSEKEKQILQGIAESRMLCIAIPRSVSNRSIGVLRLQDFHTVQGTRKADGKLKDCHITHRHYLTDASFGVVLTGNQNIISALDAYLRDPIWGIWLGRKSCIPSAPVLVGVFNSREEALIPLIGETPIEYFTRQEEVDQFTDGRDTLPDQPLSFASSTRRFAPRRVRVSHGTA